VFSFLNVDNLSVFDSNIKMQIYMFLVILVMNNINRYILWMEWLMMAYLLSDLWIEMKYRLIKMFIILLKISD
jgi:hypothetical protein